MTIKKLCLRIINVREVTMQFTEIFNSSSSVILYRDGLSHEFYKGEEEYGRIISGWNELICRAVPMPAYGVSIDKLTREEMKKGEWVEFIFDGRCEINEMPFEKLLVKVEENYCGFNIIRYNSEGGYFGRCYYLQLEDGKNMSRFASAIGDISLN